ncbi:unnamed protein product, partial [Laminaria digitata]
QLGLPIRPAFWKDPRPAADLRAELGLELDAPVAMIMGGGDGVGGMGAIAAAVIQTLGKELERSQIVVICGKNKVVKHELEDATWPLNTRVIVRGFVSNMDEWMGAVDALVTKAGPGTIAEATIRGLPVMLSGYLPGQEEGNVPYVVNGGFGAYSKKPAEIGATVARWLKNPELLEKMKGNALRAARPRASYDIAREIADMLFLEDEESIGAGHYVEGIGDESYEALMEAGKGAAAAAMAAAAGAGAGAGAGVGASGGHAEEGNGVGLGVGGGGWGG